MRNYRTSKVRLLTAVLLLAAALCATCVDAEGSNATGTRVLAPTTGVLNNLVVFIRFSDQPEFAQPLGYYDGLFNSAANSLKNFYRENSYQTLTVNSSFYPTSGGVLVSYRDSHATGYYQPYNAGTNPGGYQGAEATSREAALVSNALTAISAQIPSGLTLDSNNDGYVDHITFEVYASNANPLPVLFYSRATYDSTDAITVAGKKVGAYIWVSAVQDTPNTGSTLGATEIHEMGHSFGYPDLRANSGRQPVGDWDVMSSSKVVHSGAYMKYKFTHWIANITEISAYGTYTLNDLTQASNNSFKVRIPGSSEFLILEYRKAAGVFESNLFGSGLCVTRVNESAGMWGNLGGPPFFLYYFRQDGTSSADGYGNAWNACFSAESGRVQFNDHSNPACFVSDGNACGISIANIGSSAGSSITFALTDPATVRLTHRISGIVSLGGSRVSGATISLSGSSTGVAITDSLGNYNLVVNDGGNYTITAAKANLGFSQASKEFTNVVSDQSQNFTASYNTNTISGTVLWGGVPQPGVTVVCSESCTPQLATTNAAGAYAFTVNAGGSYDVYPGGLSGYYATPYSKSFSNVTTNLTQSFSLASISSVALATSQSPAISTQGVTFTAIVSGSAPTGSVKFTSAGIALCEAALLTNSQAQCVTSVLTVGSHSIVAIYSGDSRNSGSSSDPLQQTITAASVTITVPVAEVPVAAVPVTTVPVAEVPVAAVPVTAVPVAEVPVATVPVVEVPVATVPVAEVPAADVPAVITPVPVNVVPDPAPKVWAPLVPARVSLNAVIPSMLQKSTGQPDATLLAGFTTIISQSSGLVIGTPAQSESGVLVLPFAGGQLVALPVGEITVDPARSDGVVVTGNRIEVASKGQVTTIAPGVSDLADFARQLLALSADASATISVDGTLVVLINGQSYALQPGWIATYTSDPVGIHQTSQGYYDYVDAAGYRQLLYPAFADFAQLVAAFRQLDPALTIVAAGNGVIVASVSGVRYTLVPEYALVSVPSAHANDSWWQQGNGKLFIQYRNRTAQGFLVK